MLTNRSTVDLRVQLGRLQLANPILVASGIAWRRCASWASKPDKSGTPQRLRVVRSASRGPGTIA